MGKILEASVGCWIHGPTVWDLTGNSGVRLRRKNKPSQRRAEGKLDVAATARRAAPNFFFPFFVATAVETGNVVGSKAGRE